MNSIKKIISENTYSLSEKEKQIVFKKTMNVLIKHHYNNSEHYKKIIDSLYFKKYIFNKLQDIPFLPVRMFKNFEMLSIKKNEIFKILLSSGTSGNNLSKIYLDKINATNQLKVLQKIMNSALETKERLPMLIIDQNMSGLNRNMFNARVAAINGFSMFGKDHTFLLDQNEEINYEKLNLFLDKNYKKKFIIFGFTSFIYQNFLKKISESRVNNFNFKNAIVLHGGGWKKLDYLKISKKKFYDELNNKFSFNRIINYYGLVEQTGSIFTECKCGYYITSNFSDILIRDKNLKIANSGEIGFLQLVSLLPTSYPGHSIITEDLAKIVDKHNCKCEKNGKRFLLYGRVPSAEIRGCSDI
jgi:phenylacetate-coenzyme A ligase PaaK-like adenylate-forming protein